MKEGLSGDRDGDERRLPSTRGLVLWVGASAPVDRLRARGVEVIESPIEAAPPLAAALAPDLAVIPGPLEEANTLLGSLRGTACSVPIAVVGANDSTHDVPGRIGVVAEWAAALGGHELAARVEALLETLGGVALPPICDDVGRAEPWLRRLDERRKTGFVLHGDAVAALLSGDGQWVPTGAIDPARGAPLRLVEIPADRLHVATRGPSGGSSDARVLVIDADEARRRRACAVLQAAGAAAHATEPGSSLEEALTRVPTVIVLPVSTLSGGLPSLLWSSDRFVGASFVVLGEGDDDHLASTVARAARAERSLRDSLAGGGLVVDRLERFGPARWLKILGGCDRDLTLEVRCAGGTARVSLADQRIRAATWARASDGGVMRGKEALAELLSARWGRAVAGTAPSVEAHRDATLEDAVRRHARCVSTTDRDDAERARMIERSRRADARPAHALATSAEPDAAPRRREGGAAARCEPARLAAPATQTCDASFAAREPASPRTADTRVRTAPPSTNEHATSTTAAREEPPSLRERTSKPVAPPPRSTLPARAVRPRPAVAASAPRTRAPGPPPLPRPATREREPRPAPSERPPSARAARPWAPPPPAHLLQAMSTAMAAPGSAPPASNPTGPLAAPIPPRRAVALEATAAARSDSVEPLAEPRVPRESPVAPRPARRVARPLGQRALAMIETTERRLVAAAVVVAVVVAIGSCAVLAWPGDERPERASSSAPTAPDAVSAVAATSGLAMVPERVSSGDGDADRAQLDEAVTRVATQTEVAGPSAAELVAEAERAHRAREFRRAEALAREALRNSPDDTEARYRLALALLRQQRDDEALREAQRATEASPPRAKLYLLVGDVHNRRGRGHAAIRAWRQCLEVRRNHQPCMNRLARARRRAAHRAAPELRPSWLR